MTLLSVFGIMIYDKKADPFYKSRAWRSLRTMALQRDHYLCQDCMAAKARGEMIRPRAATVVHHILSVEARPDLRLDIDNLVSLCDACHNKRHPEKGGRGDGAGLKIQTGVRIEKV